MPISFADKFEINGRSPVATGALNPILESAQRQGLA
jgi:hypothetical protein